jgi:hypothetical protein
MQNEENNDAKGVETLDAEEIKPGVYGLPEEPKKAALILTSEQAEDQVKKEVAKIDVTQQKIRAIVKKTSAIKEIKGLEDKATYKKADEARKELKNLRTKVENKRKDIKAPYILISKGIEDHANTLKGLITPEEKRLEGLCDMYEAWETEEKERLQREKQQLLSDRVTKLIEAGIKFEGNFYTIGSVNVDTVTIGEMTPERFTQLVSVVVEEKQKADQAEADRLKAEAEEKERIAQQQKDNEEQAEKLKEQAKQLTAMRTSLRTQFIQQVGLTLEEGKGIYIYSTPSGNITVTQKEIEDTEDQSWGTMFAGIQTRITDLANLETKRKADEAEELEKKQQAENRFKNRAAMLIEIGITQNEVNPVDFSYFGAAQNKRYAVTLAEVKDLPDTVWAERLQTIKRELAEFIEAEGVALQELEKESELRTQQHTADTEAIKLLVTRIEALTYPNPALEENRAAVVSFAKSVNDNLSILKSKFNI